MKKDDFDRILEVMIQSAASISDLLFVTGRPMQVETDGVLKPLVSDPAQPVLTSERIEAMAKVVINDNERLLQDLKEHGSCDCGYGVKKARFRVNVYFENGNYAMVMRHLEAVIPSFESLNLSPAFRDIIKEKNGIVFITGGTGMGKTTTMAAILNEINKTRDVHILTLEDPIEFVIKPIKATFSQRELGRDFFDFQKGMRAAMRQAPKVIFIGEIRDRETMEIALSAGETGHLIFSTLHTNSASATINRIVGMFATEDEAQVRERLADSMRYVVSQRLVPATAGGRLLVTELMGSSLRSREAIVMGESDGRRFEDIIEAGSVSGWHSFEQSLAKAFEQQLISEETALHYSSNKAKMTQRIDNLSSKRRRNITPPSPTTSNLKMGG